MLIDQSSLFVAAGICAAALALTMLSVWLHNRADGFIVGWTAGMLLLGCGVLLYSLFPPDNSVIATIAFTMEIVGFVIIYISARLFTGRKSPPKLAITLLALTVPPVAIPITLGFDGLGIAIFNFLAGAMLAATGAQYWVARREAPSSIVAMVALYGLTALSFFACATILTHEQNWVLSGRPDNWAERFNAIMCIAGITGVGALSLGLNNARAARRHREEALTDSLTGLMNRRALFGNLAGMALPEGNAVIAFDLDRFKIVNDRYGHAAGDELLRLFADAIRHNLRPGDLAARTGGEEFVVVLRNASLLLATSTAERIRAIFAESHIRTAKGRLSGTASAGVALSSGENFDDVLHRADTSLYRAKDGGRNRVVTTLQVVA